MRPSEALKAGRRQPTPRSRVPRTRAQTVPIVQAPYQALFLARHAISQTHCRQ